MSRIWTVHQGKATTRHVCSYKSPRLYEHKKGGHPIPKES